MLVVFLLAFPLSAACDKGVTLTLANQTDVAVRVVENPPSSAMLLPYEQRSYTELYQETHPWVFAAFEFIASPEGDPIRRNGGYVVFRGVRGPLIYCEEMSWDELKAADFTVFITGNVAPDIDTSGAFLERPGQLAQILRCPKG